MEKVIVNKSKRGLQHHVKNLFIMSASNNTKGRVRRISTVKDRVMVVNENTGECLRGAGFFQYQEVDKTQFLKIYINGVRAITEVSSAGTKVFKTLYRTM